MDRDGGSGVVCLGGGRAPRRFRAGAVCRQTALKRIRGWEDVPPDDPGCTLHDKTLLEDPKKKSSTGRCTSSMSRIWAGGRPSTSPRKL